MMEKLPGWRSPVGGALALLLLALAAPAPGATKAGSVQLQRGRVTAATPDGQVRRLHRGAEVYSGDVLSTGASSYLRIAYTDGGFMMLRPNTRFLIEAYEHTGEPETDKGFFSLLKGGLRAVTGAVSKIKKTNFRLTTAAATIGIRGTDFEARVCSGGCLDIDPAPADGLYVGLVHNDAIVILNSGGEFVLDVAGTFAYTPGFEQPARHVASAFASPLTQDPMPSADPMQCE